MPLFYQPLLPSVRTLSSEESKHAVKVLRLGKGDRIMITDGAGTFYRAAITDIKPGECGFEIISTDIQPRKTYSIHIAIAPTKNMDRTEWFVEKAVEIGVDEISFMLCKTSERKVVNLDRLEKLAVSAMKQSQQAFLPRLNPMADIGEIISTGTGEKFIAFVDSDNTAQLKLVARPGNDYMILIGPEGDFSRAELDLCIRQGFEKISLGPTRLRTETAALTACLTLNLINQ